MGDGAAIRRILAGAALTLGVAAAPVGGQRAELAALDRIESGMWQLYARDGAPGANRLCIASARRFIQLRHPDVACERLVIEDGTERATVQYTCRGRGFGRTTIRRETRQLVQIDTQGIADGLPFADSIEARRIGDCRT